jgi:septal ring factor EnvC (AmiA/AmiB activator)
MAEYGEWNRKGATLSDVTAQTEYGVTREFIIKGIEAGKLEYRQGAVWGNPYLRVLRSQLEAYVQEELGGSYLTRAKNRTELRKIKKEIAELVKRLDVLQDRKKELEASLDQKKNTKP